MAPAAPRSCIPAHALPAAAIAVCLARPALAQTITDIGLVPGGVAAYVQGMGADGSTAIGFDDTSSTYSHAFRWSAPATLQDLGLLPGSTGYSRAFGVSADGACVVGQATSSASVLHAFRWTAALGMQDIGSGAEPSSASGASADGSIIAGVVYPAGTVRAFRWTSGTGMVLLPPLPGSSQSAGNAISADGSTIVGSSGDPVLHSCRWTSAGVLPIPSISVSVTDRATAVSADGSVVVGVIQFGPVHHPYRWTDTPAGMQDLGFLPGDTEGEALCISGDGSVVGGYSNGASGTRPFLWTQAAGMIDLGAYLTSVGVDTTGWNLGFVNGLSTDGSSMVGTGLHLGQSRAFIVSGIPCPATPVITAQPSSTAACAGGSASYYVSAEGDGLIYKWRRASTGLVDGPSGTGSIISGATTRILTISGVTPADADAGPDAYTCVVRKPCNLGGTATVSVALLVNSADFDNDGDTGTDADIEAFFACLAGSCCATCGNADFDADGDTGTDADIEAFFRVLAGGAC